MVMWDDDATELLDAATQQAESVATTRLRKILERIRSCWDRPLRMPNNKTERAMPLRAFFKLVELEGSVIDSVSVSEFPGSNEPATLLYCVSPRGGQFVVEVQRDAEGNGPGFLRACNIGNWRTPEEERKGIEQREANAARLEQSMQLERFARNVLGSMEHSEEWDADFVDGIRAEAERLNLASPRNETNGWQRAEWLRAGEQARA